jgi:hypothetical protein
MRACPAVGAVAAATLTSVVADFKSDAVKTFVAPVIVLFVRVCANANAASVSVAVGSVSVNTEPATDDIILLPKVI